MLKESGEIERLPDGSDWAVRWGVGGWPEIVTLKDGGEAFVNADAVKLGLQYNPAASALLGKPVHGYMVLPEGSPSIGRTA